MTIVSIIIIINKNKNSNKKEYKWTNVCHYEVN